MPFHSDWHEKKCVIHLVMCYLIGDTRVFLAGHRRSPTRWLRKCENRAGGKVEGLPIAWHIYCSVSPD
jgi:hypothetical protein